MFKHTLIAAALIASCAAAMAQTSAATNAAPAKPVAAVVAPATPAAAAVAAPVAAKAADAMPAVKKSNSNICHDASSSGYKSTKNFKPFASMDECIKSGGRAPKSAAKAKK